MIEPMNMKGKYTDARIYATIADEATLKQVQTIIDDPIADGMDVCLMPDTHAGNIGPIGLVMSYRNKDGIERLSPALVGVDIACGMLCIDLGKIEIDYSLLDYVIRNHVPSGQNVSDIPSYPHDKIEKLCSYRSLKDVDWILRSCGTLGGGNHFIELDESDEGNKYLVIHTGSRNLGKQVAEYHQRIAVDAGNRQDVEYGKRKRDVIARCKEEGRTADIEKELISLKEYCKEFNRNPDVIPYLEGADLERYLHDVEICTEFSKANRKMIAFRILEGLGIVSTYDDMKKLSMMETLHNYIDTDQKVIRKGAIRLKNGEKAIIPLSMNEGALLVTGKGADEYLQSGPHGAGRILSRTEAKERISMEEYRKSMEGIWSSSISEATIDESPFSYKKLKDIEPMLDDTCTIDEHIRPVYNFKAQS